MPEFKIHSDDGLVTTTLHGMSQNAYVVTEDKVESFNTYSLEFQLGLSTFFAFLGIALGTLDNLNGRLFAISIVVLFISFLFTVRSWYKFNKVKKNLFIKQSARDASAADVVV